MFTAGVLLLVVCDLSTISFVMKLNFTKIPQDSIHLMKTLCTMFDLQSTNAYRNMDIKTSVTKRCTYTVK